jgi:hypothetical protein
MNEQHELIFQQALRSFNPLAVINITGLFKQLDEKEKVQALLHHLYSMESYFFGTEYGFGLDYSVVQKKLNDLGVASPALVVDGIWGAKSKAALSSYQKSKGLTVDGTPGPQTLASLGISAANETASSTMGSVTPAAASADAKAYAIAKKGGAEMGLTEKEIQYTVAVARGEGYYGSGWSHPSAKTIELSKKFGLTGYEGANSNNWGAVQGSGSAGSFPHVDVHADGSGYKANYRAYKTPEDGYKDMARIILNGGKRGIVGSQEIKAAIAKGDLTKAVNAQHANGYFELNPVHYLNAVMSNYNKIMNGVGWPKLLAQNGITATVGTAIGGGLVLGGLSALTVFLIRRKRALAA